LQQEPVRPTVLIEENSTLNALVAKRGTKKSPPLLTMARPTTATIQQHLTAAPYSFNLSLFYINRLQITTFNLVLTKASPPNRFNHSH